MTKHILLIDESQLFRDFLSARLKANGFDVSVAKNGLEGLAKLRNSPPNLVIMDYYLSRVSAIDILERKQNDRNVADVPVIMVSSRVDRDRLVQVSRLGVKKFFTKPAKTDVLLRTVSQLLGVAVEFDSTPSILEANYNDEILFVEVAQGFNTEKIDLLRYRLKEIRGLYDVTNPKALIIISGIEPAAADRDKVCTLVANVLESFEVAPRWVKVLTQTDAIEPMIHSKKEFIEIEVLDNVEKAMDGLMGRKAGSYLDGGSGAVQGDFLRPAEPKHEAAGPTVDLRMDADTNNNLNPTAMLRMLSADTRVAVVDDDFVIHEVIKASFMDSTVNIDTYDNGQVFVESPHAASYDLVFLDLMMPVMDGFRVLMTMKERKIACPVIILSALSKRETIAKVLRSGVSSYLIKPIKPELLLAKAVEILTKSI